MISVGLTGGIGTGKTTVARIFKVLGIPVFDADVEAKKIMNENKVVQEKIAAIFGKESYENGKLNRNHIAAIVFNNTQKLKLLNAIVHPETIALSKKWINNQTTSYCIKEAALLFESGSAKGLDYVIGVFAPTALRKKRVMQRDNLTPEQFKNRMNKQMDEEIAKKLCDFIIVNDEQQLLIPQVIKIHDQILSKIK